MKYIWTKRIALYLLTFYMSIMFIGFVLFKSKLIGFGFFFLHFFVILVFAVGGILLYRKALFYSEKKFLKNLFWWSFIIKVCVVFFNYYIFNYINGFPFIMHSDSFAYDEWGRAAKTFFSSGMLNFYSFYNIDLSDLGGIVYYGVIYYLFGNLGNQIIIARIFNALFSSFSVILFYKTIRMISGTDISRTTGILLMLFPIFNLYAGTHYKESFFLFIISLAIYKSYKMLFLKEYAVIDVLILSFSIISTFFFRNVMGPVLFFSLLGLYYFNHKGKLTLKKIVPIIFLFVVVTILFFKFFSKESEGLIKEASTYSSRVLDQANRNKGGKFAFGNIVSTPVLFAAPLFAPIPTVVEDRTYVNKDFTFALSTFISTLILKIFLSFWALFGGFYLIKKHFNENSYIILFFIAYYLIMSISGNGFIIRYLMPILPILIYFAVVGLKQYKQYRAYFYFYLISMLFIIIFFNFKKVQYFIYIP